MKEKLFKLLPIGIISLVILVVGVVFVNKWTNVKNRELRIKEEKQRQEIRGIEDKQDEEIAKRLKLERCIENAEEEYYSRFELNSEPDPSRGEGVRKWNAASLREAAEEKLKSDKDLCIKQFK